MKKDIYTQIAESFKLAFINAKKHIEAESKQVPFTFIKMRNGFIQTGNN